MKHLMAIWFLLSALIYAGATVGIVRSKGKKLIDIFTSLFISFVFSILIIVLALLNAGLEIGKEVVRSRMDKKGSENEQEKS